MRSIEEKEQEIRQNWFEHHLATVTNAGPVTILDWKEPGTNMYAVRYLFSGHTLFISGDIGDAVFDLTWKATPESFEEIHLGYFMKKWSCSSRDRWRFNEDKAKEELKEWLGEQLEDRDEEEDADFIKETNWLYQELLACMEEYSRVDHFNQGVWNVYMSNGFNFYSSEDFEIFEDFGKELPMSFIAYLLGIKMANEQIRKQEQATA